MTLLGVIATVAVMAVGLFAVLFPKDQSYELPYGIKSDMSIGQMTRQMEDYGFEKKFFDEGSWYDSQFFKSRNVMGVKTDFSCVEYFHRNSQYKIQIGHFFKEDKQYGGDNHSKNFDNILQQLKEEYGEPSKLPFGVYWEKGKTKIALEYTKNAPCGEYWLNYMSE